MDVASVTLDEVLKAAQLRAASLVPETSGYLALAIADASARLPFRIEDDMVNLSTEGSVKVMRGTEVVQPEESAAVMRDVLERLLGCSIGSMPGLASASRARTGRETVLDVIGDLESALVPVNRSAARRALARLARETVRARERGKLDRPLRARPKSARPGARPEPEPVAQIAVAPVVAAAPAPALAAPVVVAATEVAPAEIARAAVLVSAPTPPAPPPIEVEVVFTEPPTPVEPMAQAEPTPTILASTVEDELVDERLEEPRAEVKPSIATRVIEAASAESDPVDNDAAESKPVETAESEPSRPAPAAARDAERPRQRRERRTDEAVLETQKSSVDQLLAKFQVSKLEVPEEEGAATPAPSARPPAVARQAPAAAARAARISLAPVTDHDVPDGSGTMALTESGAAPRFGARHIAFLVVALVVAGLLGHYAPRMF